MNAILDTGAGQNLIRKDALPQFYLHEVSEMKPKRLGSAASISLQVIGCIKLLMQLGQRVTITGFLGVENLVIGRLLGTAFNKQNIKSIYQKCGVVVPTGSSPVALETQLDATPQANTLKCPENHVYTEQEPLPCRVAKQKSIPDLSEALVLVKTRASGLQLVSTHDKLSQKRLALVAQGIANVVPGMPFAIKTDNWSKKPMKLPMGMVVAQCSVLRRRL